MRGKNHLAQRSHGIFAAPSTPIVTALVGRIGLTNSHNWYAYTAVCRVRPTRSASGAMMGMVNAAWAVPEWMKKLMTHCTRNITWPMTATGRAVSEPDATYSIVSSTLASCAMTSSARAQATMNTTPTISLAPVTNVRAMRLGPRPPANPSTIPMPKKRTAIWSMYHCHRRTPTTSRIIATTNNVSVTMCFTSQAAALMSRACTASRSASMSRTGLIDGSRFTFRAYHITYAIITAVPTTHVTRR